MIVDPDRSSGLKIKTHRGWVDQNKRRKRWLTLTVDVDVVPNVEVEGDV